MLFFISIFIILKKFIHVENFSSIKLDELFHPSIFHPSSQQTLVGERTGMLVTNIILVIVHHTF